MSFNSIHFILFYITVFLLYHICPYRIRYLILLGASLFFYSQWNTKYTVILIYAIIVSYISAIVCNGVRSATGKRATLCIGVNMLLIPLIYYKYIDFIIYCLSRLLVLTGKPAIGFKTQTVLPIGISFFTLQSIGYIIDVYRGDAEPERNLFLYALFISFFPQLIAGPIERSSSLICQLKCHTPFNSYEARKGFFLILYGFFLKMVIADRVALYVDLVFDSPKSFRCIYILIAIVLFSIQIYCDFYGYSTIAKGVAMTFGIKLMDNFSAPYYAISISDFWRRWHISLSLWLKDYVYIPLGGSKKGTLRKWVNLVIVFLVSGLWHGASFAFILWGGLHGLARIIEDGTKRCRLSSFIRRMQLNGKISQSIRIIMARTITFSFTCFAWLFFRAGNMQNAIAIINSIIASKEWAIDESIFNIGISNEYFIVVIIAISVLLMIDYYKNRGFNVLDGILNVSPLVSAIIFNALVFSILLFGCWGETYDLQNFVYFQF